MFSVLCVLAINDNSCVYIHEQFMVKTACPGGVNTLLYMYLKHQFFLTSYTQQVLLPRTTRLYDGGVFPLSQHSENILKIQVNLCWLQVGIVYR